MSLTDRQTDKNLDSWVAGVPDRLTALRGLLISAMDPGSSIDWPDDFPSSESCIALVTDLHFWTSQTWADVAKGVPQSPKRPWREQLRDGDYIAYSMTADIAMLIGEVIRVHRPSWNWGIDRDPVNVADGMGSVNRVVLMSTWAPEPHTQVVLDPEELVATLFAKSPTSGWYVEDNWTRLVQDAISGAHEGAHLVP